MKKLLLLFLPFCLSSIGTHSIASEIREPYKKLKDSSLYLNRKCIRVETKEEYIPGTYFTPGYVRYWKEHIQIKCPNEIEVKSCFVLKYNEEYVPGNKKYPGYVKSWHEEMSIPCPESKDKTIPRKLINKSRRKGI